MMFDKSGQATDTLASKFWNPYGLDRKSWLETLPHYDEEEED